MHLTDQPAIASIAILLTSITLATAGCSGSREDVRVTLCKDLTAAMVDSPQPLVWRETETSFRRPEYAKVQVLFEMPAPAVGEAVCFYAYDTVDENAMTHSQPLSAHATLPYAMSLNGEPVTASQLSDGIQAQQGKLASRLLETFRRWIGGAAAQPGLGAQQP